MPIRQSAKVPLTGFCTWHMIQVQRTLGVETAKASLNGSVTWYSLWSGAGLGKVT